MLDRLSVCSSVIDNSARLACYDREMAQIGRDSVAASAPPAANSGAKAAESAEDGFGVKGSEMARRVDSERQDANSALKSITAKVTTISRRPRGELEMTFDNGQVWVQKESQSYFPVKVGDEATITAGALGSFRLVVSGRSTPVTRTH